MGYCNWSSASSALASASALTFTCGRDNLKSFCCFLPKFVLHVTNDHFSDKFNNGWKKIQNGRLIAIFHLLRQQFDLVGAITWKVFHVSFSNLLCMLLMTSSRTSLIMAEKKKKWPIYCDFSHFTSIIWPCGRDNLKSFSHILFKFVMHVTNDQFSDEFNNGRKKKKMADLLRFFTFYVNNLTLWAR